MEGFDFVCVPLPQILVDLLLLDRCYPAAKCHRFVLTVVTFCSNETGEENVSLLPLYGLDEK